MRVCNKCKIEKDLNDFYRCKRDGHQYTCKVCKRAIMLTSEYKVTQQKYRSANKVKLSNIQKAKYNDHKEIYAKRNKDWRDNNKGRKAEIDRVYRENNRDKILLIASAWREKNRPAIREKKNKYVRERFKSDPLFKLQYTMRSRMCAGFKNRCVTKKENTEHVLGCSFEQAKIHLQLQFKEGMSWANHGYGKDKWHVDHIIPLANATTEEELLKLCHYTNLQPLWHQENLVKNKYPQNLKVTS